MSAASCVVLCCASGSSSFEITMFSAIGRCGTPGSQSVVNCLTTSLSRAACMAHTRTPTHSCTLLRIPLSTGCSDEDEDEDTSSQDDSEDDNDGDDGEDEEGGWVRYADSHGAGPSSSARASSSRVTQVTMVQTAQDGTTVHVTKSVTLSQAYPFIMRTGDKDTKMGESMPLVHPALFFC